MEILNWELDVLSRSIAYPNLSSAAAHVGLSQPQLSRIVAHLEEELSIPILDRKKKRKSAWTPQATRLADTYRRTFRTFRQEVEVLAEDATPTHLRIGTLEGLIPYATEFVERAFKRTQIPLIDLDVHDLNDLESYFLKDHYDLLITSREPGRKKYQHRRIIGYQTLQMNHPNSNMKCFSTFEFANKKAIKKDIKYPTLVSNSLEVRKQWIEKGSAGVLPTALSKNRPKKGVSYEVFLLGLDRIPEPLWEKLAH